MPNSARIFDDAFHSTSAISSIFAESVRRPLAGDGAAIFADAGLAAKAGSEGHRKPHNERFQFCKCPSLSAIDETHTLRVLARCLCGYVSK